MVTLLILKHNAIVIFTKLVHAFINNFTSWLLRDSMIQLKGHKVKAVEQTPLDSSLTSRPL